MLSSKACHPPCSLTVPHHSPVLTEPSWKDHLHTPDVLRQDWLFDTGSLTRRLIALSNDRFTVQPISEGWGALRADECTALGLSVGAAGWVREVYLRGAGQPWVFARSVAGQQALHDDGFSLATLGARSLGELLFVDGGFSRGPLYVSHYPVHWMPKPRPLLTPVARRSRFDRGGLGILVTEVFLPEFWAILPHPSTEMP